MSKACGVRLHHPTLRNVTFLLWEPGYKNPGSQGGFRKPKMRPLLIDDQGDTIVSSLIWERLEAANALGRITDEFILMNVVPDPPKLIVGAADGEATRTVERKINDAIREIAPAVASFTIAPSMKHRSDSARIAQTTSNRK